MIALAQIGIGLFLGLMGFLQIPENPFLGSSALLVSGLLLLSGIEGLDFFRKPMEAGQATDVER